jgi:hypothetical protein
VGSQTHTAVEAIYQRALESDSDIKVHLPILKQYTEKCDTVTEFGFRRGESTAAFFAAYPRSIVSVDWDKSPFEVDFRRIREYTYLDKDIKFSFKNADTLDATIEMTDLLFIDTFHTYEHLFLELMKHADSVNHFILIHDTEEPSCPGLFHAIEDFLLDNPWWNLEVRVRERPGLTVLVRIDDNATYQYSQAFIRTLVNEVVAQKEMYYDQIGPYGSTSPAWKDYMNKMIIRFKDVSRWPLANKRLGATEIAQKYNSR